MTSLILNAGKTAANSVITKVGANGKIAIYMDGGTADVAVDVQGYFTSDSSATAGGTFAPVYPDRLLDTRTGIGGRSTPLGAAASMTVPILGRAGIPATGVSAVAVSVTALTPTAATYLDVWPGGARPNTSNLNTGANLSATAMVQVGVAADGSISLYNSAGSANITIDVMGYYLDAAANAQNYYTPITTTRIYATRTGLNAGDTPNPVPAGSLVVVPIRGVDAGGPMLVPASDDVNAVMVSVTAAHPGASGSMKVFGDPTQVPTYGTVANWTVPDQTFVTASVIVPVTTSGTISIWVQSSTELIVDLQGYYQSAPSQTPGAPTINSVQFPSQMTSTPPTDSNAAFTFSNPESDIASYLYGLDTSLPTTASNTGYVDDLNPSAGSHTIYARAVDTAGNVGPISSYQFGVGSSPHAPTLSGAMQTSSLSTVNGVTISTSTSPTFTATGADSDGGVLRIEFQIWMAGEVDSTDAAPISAGSVVTSPDTAVQWTPPAVPLDNGDGSSTPQPPLLNGATYEARARAYDGTTASTWSPTTTFTVTPAANATPTIAASSVSPSTIDAGGQIITDVLTPSLVATPDDADGGAVGVDFEISKNGVIVASGTLPGQVPGVEANFNIPLGALQSGQTYQWRARASDTISTSAWSSYQAFTVNTPANRLPETALLSHVQTKDIFTGSIHTLEAVPSDADLDDTALNVEVRRSDNGQIVYTGTSPSGPTGSPEKVTIPSGLITSGVNYLWRARGYDGKGYGTWVEDPTVFTNDTTTVGTDGAHPGPGLTSVPNKTDILLVYGLKAASSPSHDCQDYWGTVQGQLNLAGWGNRKIHTATYYAQSVKCNLIASAYGRGGKTTDVDMTWMGDPASHQQGRSGTTHGNAGVFGHTANAKIEHLAYHLAWMIYLQYSKPGRQVAIIAHSMGGLVVRYAMQQVAAGNGAFPPFLRVNDVATLSTPYLGSGALQLLGGTAAKCGYVQCKELTPSSSFLNGLGGANNAPQGYHGTDWSAFGSDWDPAVGGKSATAVKGRDRTVYFRDDYMNHTQMTTRMSCPGTNPCRVHASIDYGVHVGDRSGWPVPLNAAILAVWSKSW